MKKILGCLLVAITASVAHAQQHASAHTEGHTLLWRISGNGLGKPSYLFGTMHIICANDYVWTNAMATSLKNSDELCLEMNIKDPAILTQIAAGMIDASGRSLHDYFTDEDYSLLSAYLRDSAHIDITIAEHMKPVFLLTLFAQSSVDCNDAVVYEEQLATEATKENKIVDGLETVSEQLDVLNTIPADTIINEIIVALHGQDSTGQKEYEQLLTAYKSQDLNKIYAVVKDSKDITDMGALLADRNRKWISRMQMRMKQHGVFFAVGAGHLPGEAGVIALLRKQGYKVEPVY